LNDAEIINYRYAWEAVPTGGSPWIFPIESEKPDRDYFVLGLGISGAFKNGTQLFFDYQTLLGHKRVTEHLLTAGVRLEF
jgi:outer membrane autotransporter protein